MRFPITCCLLLAASVAFAQKLTNDRAVVLKAGARDVSLPDVPENPLKSIPLPGGASVSFSIILTRQDVPSGWSKWQVGVTPKIIESPDGKSVTLTFSKPASAFGVELMPVWKKGRDMRLEIVGAKGKVLTQFVKFDPGARFFGFVGGKVKSVTLSKLPFDEGSFGIGRMLYKAAR